jgi:hypothetical protein
VQKLSGDAVVALVQPVAEETHSQAFAANQTFAKPSFRELVFANQGNQESR